MKMTVTLTLDVDADHWSRMYMGGNKPADEVRGDISLWIADNAVSGDMIRVLQVTDTPEEE